MNQHFNPTPRNLKEQPLQINESLLSQSTVALPNTKNPFKALPGGKLNATASGKKTNSSKPVFTVVSSTAPNTSALKGKIVTKHKTNAGTAVGQIFDLTASMTWFVDENDNLTHADGAFLHFLNIEKKDLNKKLTDILPRELREKFLSAHLSARASGIPSKKILMQSLPDGTSKQLFINIYPFTNHDRNFLVGEAFDITDEFPVQEKIVKTDERLNVLKTTTETFWESNIESGYVSGNKKLYKLIGSNLNKEITLKAWYGLIHPKDRKNVKMNHKNAANERLSNWEQEFRLKTSNRGYITLHEKGFIIYEKGEAVKMIGSLRDITELKMLESKLIKEKVKQRKKIVKTKVITQEKERTYLGNELHDNVNQLLVASKLFLEMVKPADTKSTEIKDNVSQYITAACNEIRNLSHGLVGANFGHKGLLGSFKKILDDLTLVGTFEITFNHDEKIEMLNNSKKITLLRILQEQTKNIIKHSHATKIDIGLITINDKVEFYIKDNGIGFDPGTLRRGIGLSNICERVKLYNGTVKLNTSPGKGCELKITMPVKGK